MSSKDAPSCGQNSSIGSRLREERERLGLTQEQLAKAGQVHRRTQLNYENDDRSPGAAYMNSVAKSGVDTWYVLSGIRTEFLDILSSWAAAFVFEMLAKLGYGPEKAPEIVRRAEILHKPHGGAVTEYPTKWEQFIDEVFTGAPAVIDIQRRAELDVPRLQAALAFIEGESATTGLQLGPGKRAQLATSLYRNAFQDGALNEVLARDLYRLSAPDA